MTKHEALLEHSRKLAQRDALDRELKDLEKIIFGQIVKAAGRPRASTANGLAALVLRTMTEYGKALSSRDISNLANVSPTSISTVLARLAAQGYVNRHEQPGTFPRQPSLWTIAVHAERGEENNSK